MGEHVHDSTRGIARSATHYRLAPVRGPTRRTTDAKRCEHHTTRAQVQRTRPSASHQQPTPTGPVGGSRLTGSGRGYSFQVTLLETIVRRRLIDPSVGATVVLIEAPSGYGKSVLAEQLIEAWGLAPLRVRLIGETGPDELVDRIRRAARRTGLGDIVAALAGEQPMAALDNLVTMCVSGRLDLTLLVDDAHFLTSVAVELFTQFVADMPESCCVVICRRPDGAIGAFRSWYSLSIDDLKMTRSEIAELLGERARPSLIDDLQTITTGWPAAISVAVGRLRDDPSWSPSHRSAGIKLLGGLIEDLIQEQGDVLTRLAVLPMLDEFTAEQAAGHGALTILHRTGLPHRFESGWTTIPDSIRDGLLSRSSSIPALPAESLLTIAQHYAARGELAAAIQLLSDAHLYEQITDLLARQHWTDLEALGLTQVDQLLDLFGETGPASAAELALRAIWAAEANHPILRAKFHDRLTRLEGLPPPLTRAVEAERIRTLTKTIQPSAAVECADRLLALTPPDELITRGRALLASAHAHAVLGTEIDHTRAHLQFEQAAQLFEITHEHRWRAEALARLGYSVLFHQGRPHDGVAAMETALSLLPSGDRTRAAWLSSYADVLDTVGKGVEAQAAANEAIDIGERLNDHGVIGLGLWSRAWIAGRRGDHMAVRGAMREVEKIQPGWLSSHSGIEFYGSIADFLVTLGDVDGTRYCETKARRLHEQWPYQAAIDMMTARIEAHIGDAGTALRLLEHADASVGAQHNTRWVRRLESALACLRLGDLERARAFVDDAMRMTLSMGVPDLPARFERPLLDQLAVLNAVDSATAITAAEEPFVITLLGTFSVRHGHRDLTPPAGHPSTLVKLLALRRRLTIDAVIDELWPDVDVDTGRARLRNTMNRLRSRSGAIVERQGESLILGPSSITDVDAFDGAAADALAADHTRRIGLARIAISMYADDLLPGDVFDDWAAAPRERLRRRFLALIDLVAEAAEAEGSLDEAARLLDIGIASDPLDEQRYIRLGQLLRSQGRTGASRQISQQGIAVFTELGLEPSRELLQLGG